jgi:hypothetical protein
MRKHLGVFGTSLVAAFVMAALMVAVRPASATHDPDVSDNESTCQVKGAQVAWKYGSKRMKCVIGCQRDVFEGSAPPSECVDPFAGATQGCVNGASGKSQGSFCKACQPDTPECYPSGNCPDVADAVFADVETEVDALLGDAFCDDTGSGDGLTNIEFRCQVGLAKYLAAFVYRKARCLAKCHAYEHKGAIPVGSCTPGAITDPTGKTQACITKLTDKTKLKIDRYCSALQGADAPECHAGQSAQDWTDDAEQRVDGLDDDFFCGSPSGAFLD